MSGDASGGAIAPDVAVAPDVPADPPASAGPQVTPVVLGSGGDPLTVILLLFCVGSLALGILLTGSLAPLGGLTGIVPIIAAATGLALVVGTVWALLLGITIVAGVAGIFAGFWLSLPAMLLGLAHDWYAVPGGSSPIASRARARVAAATGPARSAPLRRTRSTPAGSASRSW